MRGVTRFEIFQGKYGKWYWRLVHPESENYIARSASSWGFETKADCERDVHLVMSTSKSTPICEVNRGSKANE